MGNAWRVGSDPDPDPELGPRENTAPQQADHGRIPNPRRKFGSTMVHSHFAVMGGFAVDSGDSEIDFMPPGYSRLTIPTKSLRLIAEEEPALIPDISEAQICDKSNANRLAKTLVCFQAMWFCVQCICRLAQGLAISLLELNTFAHATCTILIYLLWWNKPLDIQEPIVLTGPNQSEMAAYLCVRSKHGTSKPALIKPGSPQVSRTTVCLLPLGRSNYCSRQLLDVTMSTAQLERVYCEPNQPVLRAGYFRLYLGRSFRGFNLSCCVTHYKHRSLWSRTRYFWEEETEDAFKSAFSFIGIPSFFAHVDLAPGEIRRFDLVERACKRWPRIANTDLYEWSSALVTASSDWPSHDGADTSSMEIWMGITFAGLLYGCLHISAWNAHFSSPVQALLWRLSAVTLSVPGPVTGLVPICIYIYRMIFPNYYEKRGIKYHIKKCFAWLSGILFLGYFVLYCFARVDLVWNAL
ncbi:hypothetical protein NA56DRAFT_739178 [Hyaloscypha hepaticicola]|uniref:Uncharacterized protein n=1 Tax=Hyaloscypha hepaticicola TaxID=2082293 RepID=A0A2J6PFN3_9HELO|nr:hypothetical protein NA56DRAFT_739178 [Hyaloscypha hepaticicola]